MGAVVFTEAVIQVFKIGCELAQLSRRCVREVFRWRRGRWWPWDRARPARPTRQLGCRQDSDTL